MRRVVVRADAAVDKAPSVSSATLIFSGSK